MAHIAIFHGITGLEPGAAGLEGPLRSEGHTVHCPDLYQGHRFESAETGYAFMEEVGFGTLLDRAEEAMSVLPPETVLIGISMGTAVAQHLARRRPDAAAAVLLHAAPGPAEGDPAWPPSVPVQIHSAEGDFYFMRTNADALVEEAAGGRLVLYPGSGHTFADPEVEDYDPEQAPILVRNVCEFIAETAGEGP
ncbi:MAG: alpha/beta fold hydrolase [Solirubrobacterales bacterium]